MVNLPVPPPTPTALLMGHRLNNGNVWDMECSVTSDSLSAILGGKKKKKSFYTFQAHFASAIE